MPSGKVTAGDGSRPSKGVQGGTTKSSTALKRLLKEINGLSSVDKKELATTLMGLALIEDEQREKSLRTVSKPGKSAPKGANGGAIPKKKSFAGALSGANKGVETPPKGNSGRYECLTESPVQMTPRKSTAKRRLSDGRPQVLRPVDQAQIGHRSSQLTTLVRVAEAELGLGGSPAKKQRTASPVQKTPEKREEMETVVSPPEEVLATPLPEAEEGEILSDGERSDWTTIPTSREERERKEAKKQKKREEMKRRDAAQQPPAATGNKKTEAKKNEEKKRKSTVQPIVGVKLPSSVNGPNHLTFIQWCKRMGVKVSETRRTMGKDLLIFPETEEDSKKIYESMKREDSGLMGTSAVFRPPRSSTEAKVEDALSVVVKDVDTTIGEGDIEKAILEKQGLKVKVIRFINRTSGRGIPKVKVTFEKKEEMEAAISNSRLFIGTRSCRTEEYKKKNRILQCYRCQRFGHAQDSCKARDIRCGKCAGAHRRQECTARASYCANCTGDHLASDGRCPRAIEVKRKIAEKREGQRHRSTQEVNRRSQPTQHREHQRQGERADQPKKASGGESELSLIRLADSDLTRLALLFSAHTVLYSRTIHRNEGKLEWDDIPHLASKAVGWAFRKEISPLIIRDYLSQLPENL